MNSSQTTVDPAEIKPFSQVEQIVRPAFYTGSVFKKYLDDKYRVILFAVLLGLFVSLPGAAAAGFLAFFVNVLLKDQQSELVPVFFAAVAFAIIVQLVLGWAMRRTLVRLGIAINSEVALDMTWTLLRLPSKFFTQRQAGDVAWRLQLPGTVTYMLTVPLPAAVAGMISLLVYFVAMLWLHPAAAAIGVLIAALNILVLRMVGLKQRLANRQLVTEVGRLNSLTTSGLSSIEYLKSTGTESDMYNRFVAQQSRMLNARQRLAIPDQIVATMPGFLGVIASAAVIGIAAVSVINGTLSIGGLLALQALMIGFLAPIVVIMGLSNTTRTVASIVPKIEEILLQEPEIKGVRSSIARHPSVTRMEIPEPVQKLKGEIEFRNVVFGYREGSTPLLQGLSFILPAGHRIAIVGTSGAGKSTVSRLLTGLETPWEGEILIDGIPKQNIDPAVLTSSLALVDQRIVLFPGSIMDNLTLWDAGISQERVITAARDAQIHDAIVARPGGYSSQVVEGAGNFSGGQAQRLEIARALAGDPTIVVLDEATSALDTQSEVLIDNAVRRRGCTSLVIAHRLSTIRDADLILVLDKGKVVQSGRHDELMAQQGLYQELVEN